VEGGTRKGETVSRRRGRVFFFLGESHVKRVRIDVDDNGRSRAGRQKDPGR
jgi:hypothetical protein